MTEQGCIFKGKSSHLWLEQETQLALNIGKVDLIRFIGMQTNITAAMFSRKCLKAVCTSLNNIVGKYFMLGAVAILQKNDADLSLLKKLGGGGRELNNLKMFLKVFFFFF